MFSFKAVIVLLGYHVHKETWSNAKMNEKVKVELKAYPKLHASFLFYCTFCCFFVLNPWLCIRALACVLSLFKKVLVAL